MMSRQIRVHLLSKSERGVYQGLNIFYEELYIAEIKSTINFHAAVRFRATIKHLNEFRFGG